MYLYLLLMLVFAIAPSVILAAINRKHVDKATLAVASIILFVIGTAWDWLSVNAGVWTFFPGELLGVWIGVLPLEEYLFSFFVPFLCINVFILVRSALIALKARSAVQERLEM